MARNIVLNGARATGVGLALVLTIGLVQGDTVPRGEVTRPRLGEILLSDSQVIVFSGWVDFPGSQGSVTISVRTGPTTFTDVGIVSPSASGTTVGGVTRHNWSFSGTRRQLFSNSAWPEGGTARARVRAVRFSGGSAFLRVLDGSLVPGHNEEIVIADPEPTPADLPAADSPNYLSKQDSLDTSETRRYYQSVRTDPHGSGQSIESALPTLESFKHHYFEAAASCRAPGQGPEYVATYFNQGDLGLGREMHCVRNECTHELACYVKNYGNPDGTPVFNRMDQAAAAVQAKKPFATVAMVERADMDLRADNKVFFAVYDHQHLLNPGNPDSAPLALQAQLDNKGFNKSIPNNCLVCHGVNSKYVKSSLTAPTAKVKGAYFLPFDLSSFAFFSTSAASPLSRPKQEATFKGLNQLVYFSDLWFNGDANHLLDGWYGGSGWTSPTFQGSFVPDGWQNPGNAADDGNRKQLYLNVVARSCRTCHITDTLDDDILAGSLTFGSFKQLQDAAPIAYTEVCAAQHIMPNAEQSLREFWRSPARAHFLNRLSLPGDCNIRGSAVSRTVSATATATARLPAIGVPAVVERYAFDSCNCATRDCVNSVDDQYLRDLAVTPLVPSSESPITAMIHKASQCRQGVLAVGATTPADMSDLLLERERERSQRNEQGR